MSVSPFVCLSVCLFVCLQGAPRALLMDMGCWMWNHPHEPLRCGGKNFKKAVAEVATVELLCFFYVIIKIVIMPAHLLWMYVAILYTLVILKLFQMCL